MRQDDFQKMSSEEKRAFLSELRGKLSIDRQEPSGQSTVLHSGVPAFLVDSVERPFQLLALSASSEAGLREQASRAQELLAAHPEQNLARFCSTMNAKGAPLLAYRLAIIAQSTEQMRENIVAFVAGKPLAAVQKGQISMQRRPKIAFLFTGQGSQYAAMGRLLYETQPVFRLALDRCARLTRQYLDRPLLEVIFPEPNVETPLNDTAYTQPALFALEYALAELWQSWGIVPDVLLGHSIGEYVAACVAGMFTLEDGLSLIAQRARLMQNQPRVGMMAAVRADESQVAHAIQDLKGLVVVAVVNGPEQTIISGRIEAVQATLTRLQALGIDGRPLNVSHAFHSPLMEPVREPLMRIAQNIPFQTPKIPIISNLTGRQLLAAEGMQADYWVRHMCEPVRFLEDLRTLATLDVNVFIEIGPASTLLSMGKKSIGFDKGLWLPSLLQGKNDREVLLGSLGALYVYGGEINWQGFSLDDSTKQQPSASQENEQPQHAKYPTLILDPEHLHDPFPLTDIQASYFVGKQALVGGDRIGCHKYLEFAVDKLDVDRLKASWHQLVVYHPMLRALITKNGQQRVLSPIPAFTIQTYDLFQNEEELATHLNEVRDRLSHKLYVPGTWPLFEICTTKIDTTRSLVHVSMDSWIVDGASADMLYEQWYQLYHNPQLVFPLLTATFRDYVYALKRFEDSPIYEQHLRYWVQKLRRLPVEDSRIGATEKKSIENVSSQRRRNLQARLDESVWTSLKKQAKDLDISPTVLLLTAFIEVLSSYTVKEASAIVLTQQNRLPIHPQINQVVGPFTTTSVLLTKQKDAPSLAERARLYQKQIWEDLDHSSVSASSALKTLSAESGKPVSLPIVFTSRLSTGKGSAARPESWLDSVTSTLTQTPGVVLDYQAVESKTHLNISWDVVDAWLPKGMSDEIFAAYLQILSELSKQQQMWQIKALDITTNAQKKVLSIPDRKQDSGEFPLSVLQQSYFVQRLNAKQPTDVSSNVYQEFEIEQFDIERFKIACQKLLEAHEMLKVSISPKGTQKIRTDLSAAPFSVAYLDRHSPSELEKELAEIRQEMLTQPFPLGAWPFFEIRVTQTNTNKALIHICIDMLIADGYSVLLICNHLFHLYADPGFRIPRKQISFQEYIHKIGDYKQKSEYQVDLEYWKQKLKALPAGPSFSGGDGSKERKRLEGQLPGRKSIEKKAHEMGVSPDSIFIAAFNEVMRVWGDSSTFTTMIALLDRTLVHPLAAHVVGDFTYLCWIPNTEGSMSFTDLIKYTNTILENDLAHRNVSGIEGARSVSLEDVSRAQIFPVVFTSCRSATLLVKPPLFTRGYGLSHTPGVDLDCFAFEEDGQQWFHWDYRAGAFPEQIVKEMFASYLRLLTALESEEAPWQAQDLRQIIHKTPVMASSSSSHNPLKANEALQQKVIHEWNATEVEYDRRRCLHHLFEEQARSHPLRIATITKEGSLTYAEINQRANQVAHYLRKKGVIPGTLVGICVERSHEMIIAVMAILKIGCAYVPLEPSDPIPRRALILEVSRVETILSQEAYLPLFQDTKLRIVPLDRRELFAGENAFTAPPVTISSSDPAYAIFTSGSTGRPKGVLVTHQPVVNLIEWIAQKFRIGPDDCALFVSPFTFDLSVYDIFGLLACGGRIRIVSDEERRDAMYLSKVLCEEKVTFWNSAPAVLQSVVPFLGEGKRLPKSQHLRLVFLSGDWIPLSLPDTIRSVFHHVQVISLGGATEATVWSNYFPVETVDPRWRSIPYGRPIQNAKYYILDDDMDICAIDVPGELYIGGECLSSGYLNDPVLTAERFIRDPFDATGRGRLYKTGDMARYWADGIIEILGRVDHQVKIRGYRVELGEVEFGLRQAGLLDVVVVARKDSTSNNYLIAFGIPEKQPQRGEEIQERLRQIVPGYMVPAFIVLLGALPVTSNGKIDRKTLLEMDIKALETLYPVNLVPTPEGLHAEETSISIGPDQRVHIAQTIETYLRREIAELIDDSTPESLESADPFGRMGLTSLHFAILSANLLQNYKIEVSPTLFYKYSALDALVKFLLDEYAESFAHDTTETDTQLPPVSGTATEVKDVPASITWQEPLLEMPTGNGYGQVRQESLEERVSPRSQLDRQIAVVGMAGRMPKAANLEEFWHNLITGRDCIEEIPEDRWDWREYYGDPEKERGKTFANRGGFLESIEAFDAEFFSISPREAELMDPRQRLLLETVWQAIEDAGYKLASINGSRTGVFVGGTGDDFSRMSLTDATAPDAYTLTGISPSLLANRISYHLNLHGPSEVVDTACSSSLIAVHRAVSAIRYGECDEAIAAGVNLMLDPITQINLSRVGMLSPDGKCKTFDTSANGYVRGEGVGVVLLKPLAKAIADHDHIYGVIKGSAVNHGGRAASLTAPNPVAQTSLLIDAYHDAAINPSTVGYIETHGTGTALGDPIEINGLIEAFSVLYKEYELDVQQAHCGLGAVKTNIGHLESASGMAGLLKILLALKHKQIPLSLHLKKQNPHIQLNDTPFYIVRESKAWTQPVDAQGRRVPRRAGVSAFGFGGANGHIIVEEYNHAETTR